MKNSGFRKTMENVRNYKKVKLVTSREKYAKYGIKPNFKGGYSFWTVLFAVEREKLRSRGITQLSLERQN